MTGTPSAALVTLPNLGTDFDIGGQVANKLNIVAATTAVAGKMRFATTAQAQAQAALLGLDAPTLVSALSAIMTAWLATLPKTAPATAGVWWNDGGVPTLSTTS